MKKIFRWITGTAAVATLLLFLFIFLSAWLVERQSRHTYNSTYDIPHNKVGLLLGTSKYVQKGRQNLFYQYRINAAVQLYRAGKIDYLLISGDNGTRNYDEPTTMKKDLTAQGIPAERIFLDYAGFRTLDSVVRSKKIFGQERITIISQQFHNERAIYLARHFGMEAIGFNARDVGGQGGVRTKLREILARTKMMLDLLVGKQPKYLGEPITIP